MREIVAWCVVASLVCLVAWFRRRALNAEERGSVMLSRANWFEMERDYWKGACRRSYDVRPLSLTNEQANRIMHDLFGEMPGDLLIGTASNPLKLTRVLDRSLDDTARYSTLDDFAPKVLP